MVTCNLFVRMGKLDVYFAANNISSASLNTYHFVSFRGLSFMQHFKLTPLFQIWQGISKSFWSVLSL